MTKSRFPANPATLQPSSKNVAKNVIKTLTPVGFGEKLALAKHFGAASNALQGNTVQKAVNLTTPQGLGLASEVFKKLMVQRLQAEGIDHPAVLRAFLAVPRHCFVDAALASQAYEDTSLPIGLGQTISKPSVVARMLQLLLQAPGIQASASAQGNAKAIGARVLEIGTGCGYQAALLAHLAMHVTSIERLSGLHDKATANLAALPAADQPHNLQLLLADGMLGHSRNAPYMGIVAAAGGDAVPRAWTDQLAVGGRIVAPVAGADGQQWLTVVDKTAQGLHEQRLAVVQFVPLKSGTS